jgi:phenylacetate-CoA ligase
MWISRLYARSPVWLQNAGISLYGLKYRRERLGGDFDRYVDEYRAGEAATAGEFEERVARRLRTVLQHAAATVPYYRERWNSHDFHDIPITPKSDLRDAPERFVSDAAGPLKRLPCYYTSGSTGTPIKVYSAPDNHRRFIAAREARSFGWAGASVRMPRSMIGGRMILPRHDAQPPFYRRNWAEHQVYFSAYHISRAHAAHYVEGFNRYRPQLLTGYANAHYQLARFMLDLGLRLDYRPRALVLSSEKLTPEMKQTIEAAFGARAWEEYGAVENCLLATECEHGRLHVSPDFGIVEIVDDHGTPLPPGEIGRVICTGLANRTQPLIRYEIGDLASWAKEPCPCGRRNLPVLEQLVGRLEDIVVSENGQVTVRFHGIFVNLPNVLEGQVIQEALDRIRVRVVTRAEFGEADIRIIRSRIADERLGRMTVEVERVAEIERTERGKFRAVITRLPREIIEQALRGRAPA